MGIIYKIDILDKTYIGSTKQLLIKREYRHNGNLRDNNFKQLIYEYARSNNINKLKCVEIENCNNNILIEREQYYIDNCLNLLNSRNSKGLGKNHYDEKYRKSDKGKITKAKADKKYYDNHEDKIKINQKEYYNNNKDKWQTEEMKKKQKDRDKVKVICDKCNIEILKKCLSRHNKRIHQN